MALLESPQARIHRSDRLGGPRERPAPVAGDKSYTGRAIRGYLRRKGMRAIIPRLATEPRCVTHFDRATYRARNRVERSIGRLKTCRRIAMQYEMFPNNYLAMVALSAILRRL